jgi:drug/metabolite transporter (DMT)-like permease
MMFIFGEHKSWVDIGAIAVAIFGVYLLASGDSLIVEGGNTKLGLTCSIISAFSFAAYYILMKKLRADKIEVVKFNTWITMLISIYFIACALIFEGSLSMITGAKLSTTCAAIGQAQYKNSLPALPYSLFKKRESRHAAWVANSACCQ